MSSTNAGTPTRYDALDSARAAAMLLGVLYHTMPAGLGMGMGMGMGAGPEGALAFLNRGHPTFLNGWLHSFRMPLFFLISGFFSHMVYRKYGPARYLARRWWRIGGTLVVALFAVAGLHFVLMGAGGPGALPPPPPRGVVPPPLVGYDADHDGSLTGAEWERAWNEVVRPGAPHPGPGGTPPPPPRGMVPPPLARFDADRDGSLRGAEWEEAWALVVRKGGPQNLGGGGDGGRPFGLAKRLFGAAAPLFHLRHLWFLWYVLVFTTAAPLAALLVGGIVLRAGAARVDRVGLAALRLGLAPLALALLSVPAMLVAGWPDWTFGQSTAIEGLFPDFLFQYQADWPFQFLYFLAGWWLYRERLGLPDLARVGLGCLVVGMAAFLASGFVFERYAHRNDLALYGLVRVGGFATYALATAYTAFGFLGAFQRYLDRPTRLGRYFADTALWVYLVHVDLIGPVMSFSPAWPLPWWGKGLLGTALVTGIACLLYELVVRRTVLVRLFGPATPRGRGAGPEVAVAETPASL